MSARIRQAGSGWLSMVSLYGGARSVVGRGPEIIGRPGAAVEGYGFRHADGEGGPPDQRARGHGDESAEGVLPGDRLHEARPRELLPGGGRGRPARRRRPADGAEAVRRRGRRAAVLPEAGA